MCPHIPKLSLIFVLECWRVTSDPPFESSIDSHETKILTFNSSEYLFPAAGILWKNTFSVQHNSTYHLQPQVGKQLLRPYLTQGHLVIKKKLWLPSLEAHISTIIKLHSHDSFSLLQKSSLNIFSLAEDLSNARLSTATNTWLETVPN